MKKSIIILATVAGILLLPLLGAISAKAGSDGPMPTPPAPLPSGLVGYEKDVFGRVSR